MRFGRSVACGLAQRGWRAACLPRARRFERALRDPDAAQWRVLERIVRRNRDTAYGRAHGFASVRSAEAWRRRVPIVDYDGLSPWIERVARGEPAVLTRDRVLRLLPSSGSTAARKLLPWTRAVAGEWSRAVQPWISDLFARHPGVHGGPAYWSVSPALDVEETESAVPVGFEEDTAYLGGVLQRVVRPTLAVPEELRLVRGAERFRYLTALSLLRSPDLRLVSVWHPSFFGLLLDAVEDHWPRLLHDVARGTLTLPADGGSGAARSVPEGVRSGVAASRGLPQPVLRALRPSLRPDPTRARALAAGGPGAFAASWPRLAVLSCWADGPAAGAAAELRERLPGIELQSKGLVATEGVVSIPFGGARPVAVRSHVVELVDADGRSPALSEVREGGSYGVVLTTGAGLYRYRLGDRVRVDGFAHGTPTLTFVGREDRVTDLRGEKLNGAFVADVLERLFEGGPPRFAMLAPDPGEGPPGYTLYLGDAARPPDDLPRRLDEALSANPHYRACRRLGQLRPVALFRLAPGAHGAYLAREAGVARRAGAVKPAALSARSDWSRHLPGAYDPPPATPPGAPEA